MKIILLALMLASSVSYALPHGGQEGNGGDMCENRFQAVRDDIKSWILNGGSAGLQFPAGISYGQYNQSMLNKISSAKITCTDDQIFVGNAEKTCKNYVAADGTVLVDCNTSRFMATSESDQYVLVHHEYAGLAGFEVNDAETSDYQISNQLTGFLADQVIKRLVVKPPTPPGGFDPFDESSCQGSPMTKAEALAHFTPGTDTSNSFGTSAFYQRSRICNEATGCTPFALLATPTISTYAYCSNCPGGFEYKTEDWPTADNQGAIKLKVAGNSFYPTLPYYERMGASEPYFPMYAECTYIGDFADGHIRCTKFIKGFRAVEDVDHNLFEMTGVMTNSCIRLVSKTKTTETVWYGQF